MPRPSSVGWWSYALIPRAVASSASAHAAQWRRASAPAAGAPTSSRLSCLPLPRPGREPRGAAHLIQRAEAPLLEEARDLAVGAFAEEDGRVAIGELLDREVREPRLLERHHPIVWLGEQATRWRPTSTSSTTTSTPSGTPHSPKMPGGSSASCAPAARP